MNIRRDLDFARRLPGAALRDLRRLVAEPIAAWAARIDERLCDYGNDDQGDLT